jgi:cob(I)alamin adenosyltransferase
VEVVLTGRGAPKELLDLADYVTEMRAVRHPYQKGVLSRQGVDR